MGPSTEQRERLSNLHSAIINDVTDEMGIDDNVIPCTGIESLWQRDPIIGTAHPAQRVEGARRLVENQGIDVIHPDVPKNGGMLETKKIADMAKSYYIPLALHNVASPVGTMASAHVAPPPRTSSRSEYHARDVPWWGDVVEEDVLDPGRIELSDDPGLGVTLDMDVVESHLLEDEELFDEE